MWSSVEQVGPFTVTEGVATLKRHGLANCWHREARLLETYMDLPQPVNLYPVPIITIASVCDAAYCPIARTEACVHTI